MKCKRKNAENVFAQWRENWVQCLRAEGVTSILTDNWRDTLKYQSRQEAQQAKQICVFLSICEDGIKVKCSSPILNHQGLFEEDASREMAADLWAHADYSATCGNELASVLETGLLTIRLHFLHLCRPIRHLSQTKEVAHINAFFHKTIAAKFQQILRSGKALYHCQSNVSSGTWSISVCSSATNQPLLSSASFLLPPCWAVGVSHELGCAVLHAKCLGEEDMFASTHSLCWLYFCWLIPDLYYYNFFSSNWMCQAPGFLNWLNLPLWSCGLRSYEAVGA